jgi:antitoxin VapB
VSIRIKDLEAERLILELARRTGESITQAVREAVRERLERMPPSEIEVAFRKRKLATLLAYFDALPRQNEHLTNDEILGYDEAGLPGQYRAG